MTSDLKTIAVIGLGYVGLPLAVEFGKARPVIGYDINTSRIDALREGHDATLEVSNDELATADQFALTSNPTDLAAASIYIVTVPTPIDTHKRIGTIRAYRYSCACAMGPFGLTAIAIENRRTTASK